METDPQHFHSTDDSNRIPKIKGRDSKKKMIHQSKCQIKMLMRIQEFQVTMVYSIVQINRR